jgi:hypothetical protein
MTTAAFRLRFALVLSAPLLFGCTYLSNRAKDCTDILSLGVSLGGSVLARVRATRLVTVEVGAQKDELFHGWSRRHATWQESSYGFFFANVWSPTVGDEKPPDWSWWDLLKTSHTKLELLDKGAPYEETKYHLFLLTYADHFHWIHVLDLEVNAGALFVGLQLTVRPGELLDLLAGFVGLDPAGDDAEASADAPAAPS